MTITSLFLLATTLLTTPEDVLRASDGERTNDYCFALSGVVTGLHPSLGEKPFFIIEAGGVSLPVINLTTNDLARGDVVTIDGDSKGPKSDITRSTARSITVSARRELPAPPLVRFDELLSPELLWRTVRVRGKVIDLFLDDIDPDWIHIILNSGNEYMYASLLRPKAQSGEAYRTWTGAEVEIEGICSAHLGDRVFRNRHLVLYRTDDVKMISRPPTRLADIPPLAISAHAHPSEINPCELKTVRGRIIARTTKGTCIMRTNTGIVVDILPMPGESLPEINSSVCAAGFPRTDLFHLRLVNARIETEADRTEDKDQPLDVSAAELFGQEETGRRFHPQRHGELVRLSGTILAMPRSNDADSEMLVQSGAFTVPIVGEALSGIRENLSVGCRIAVTGIFAVESDDYHPSAPFPRVRSAAVIIRSGADITVLARPPWWTRERLAIAGLSLLAAVILLLVLVRILRRVIAKRTEELAEEQLGRERADLKAAERTRLAVELHDSLSQNLSGVACQIASLKTALSLGETSVEPLLSSSEAMLQSSRTELQRCLFDLRSNTLDQPDFTKALRQAITPVTVPAELDMQMTIPRESLSDQLAHAIICIVRELAGNAVRHGHAKRITVKGTVEDGRIHLSVKDDGSGFDTARHPGPEEGHFGLDGIRERLRRLDGEFSISSSPTHGTCANIIIGLK